MKPQTTTADPDLEYRIYSRAGFAFPTFKATGFLQATDRLTKEARLHRGMRLYLERRDPVSGEWEPFTDALVN